jgi:WD40 repeat protein
MPSVPGQAGIHPPGINLIHKRDKPGCITLFRETMVQNFRVYLIIATLILIAGIATPVSAGLGLDWKDHPQEGNIFSGITFSSDGSVVFAGGSKMLLRSWTGDRTWGGKAGTAAAMSADSNYTVSANGNNVVMYDRDGVDTWTRIQDKNVRAVAISSSGSFVVEADDSGLIQSWARNGDFIGRNTEIPLVKSISISRDGSLVVVTTEAGLKFLTPGMSLIWEDTKNGSLDTFIAISDDGSTVITAGGPRVSSHTSNGQLNWMTDFTKSSITDMACSGDCSVIVIGDQDGKVQIINRLGIMRWDFSAPPWINAVGVSRSGQVIAVGSLDHTLYVLDGGGREIARAKINTNIQQRSVAVSRDGNRIALADENTLYGYELALEPELTLPTRTLAPRPSETIIIETPRVTATSQVMTQTPTPLPTPTKSGLDPVIAIISSVGLVLVMSRRKS